ncbi:MAG: Gfo/Idh/MocA family oxidoreductase [Planctomycetes bacterium]|nr:Gfo/Idh/MocA family oxidoreductase [Planctomycetota bacterium]MDA0947477.1 Gfo/Idh/MocA family oxidoreductase [Planctomycetota bacterium]
MTSNPIPPSRRTLLQTSGAAAAALTLSRPALALPPGRARRRETLRVALVGCGGRGTGAAMQALATEGDVKLVTMADAFSDRLEGALEAISQRHGERVEVPAERRHVGFDAYQKAIDEDVDVVLLATPPGFRPSHFEYAISKDRHVFMEKPVATDAPGVRKVLAAAEASRQKGLKVGVGLQRHHDAGYQETVRRVQEGAIGDLILMRCYWNSAGVWVNPRRPEQSEMEFQMRNWYYFNWLCGDHIAEQHIHNIDVCNWVKGGPPVKAQGVGGRQVRTGNEFGEIFDHHMVEFTYADGTKLLSECRHQKNTWGSVSEHAHGTKGTATFSRYSIETEGEKWRYREEVKNPYQVEHDRLFAAIRSGVEHNEAEYGATSTMTSILGRMATYSGKEVDMEKALASENDLMPERLAWDAAPKSAPLADGSYPIPTPGVSEPY